MRPLAPDRSDGPVDRAAMRRRILDAVADEFSLRGRRGLTTTLSHVAARLGIARSAIYYYFVDRDDLLSALLTRSFDELDATVERAAGSAEDPPERLRAMLRAHVEFNVDRSGMALFFAAEFTAMPAVGVERGRALAARFREAIAAASCAAPAPLTAQLLLGTANSVRTWFVPDGPLSATELAEVVVTVLCEGLAAGPGVGTPIPYGAPPAPLARVLGPGRLRRDDVLAAARAELAAAPGTRLSLSRLAAGLGVTRQAVYHHFARREDLVVALMDGAHAELVAAVDAAGGDPLARLRAMTHAHARVIATLTHLIGLGITEWATLSDGTRDAIRVRVRVYRRGFADAYSDAAAAGAVRRLDPDLAAHLLVGAGTAVTRWFRPDAGLAPATIADSLDRLLFGGVCGGVIGGHAGASASSTAASSAGSSPGT